MTDKRKDVNKRAATRLNLIVLIHLLSLVHLCGKQILLSLHYSNQLEGDLEILLVFRRGISHLFGAYSCQVAYMQGWINATDPNANLDVDGKFGCNTLAYVQSRNNSTSNCTSQFWT